MHLHLRWGLGGRGLADVCLVCIRCWLPLRATCCLLSACAIQLQFPLDEKPSGLGKSRSWWSAYLMRGTGQFSGNLWREIKGICSLLVLTTPFLTFQEQRRATMRPNSMNNPLSTSKHQCPVSPKLCSSCWSLENPPPECGCAGIHRCAVFTSDQLAVFRLRS